MEKTAKVDIDDRSRREGGPMNGRQELCGICSMVERGVTPPAVEKGGGETKGKTKPKGANPEKARGSSGRINP